MKKLSIFVLGLLFLAPLSITATEIDETQEMMESLSDDGTGTWGASAPLEGIIYTLAIDPSHPSILYAGTGGGLFKSTNGGASWSANSPPFPFDTFQILTLAIDPTSTTTMYAGTAGCGIWWSTDGGKIWTTFSLNTSCAFYHITYALAIDPSNPNILYAGEAEGVTKWTNILTSINMLNMLAQVATALAIDHLNPDTIYAGTNVGVYKSTNGAYSWSAISDGLTTTNVNTLVVNPSAPSTLYAGTDGDGVFKSTDAGTTWSTIGPANTTKSLISVTPTAQNYGTVKVKKSKTTSFKLTNTGKANLSILASTITGDNASMFTITSAGGSKTIKPGKSLTLKVAFKPTSQRPKSATLEITSNDPVSPTLEVPLTGTGQ